MTKWTALVLSGQSDYITLKHFSSLHNSMILWSESPALQKSPGLCMPGSVALPANISGQSPPWEPCLWPLYTEWRFIWWNGWVLNIKQFLLVALDASLYSLVNKCILVCHALNAALLKVTVEAVSLSFNHCNPINIYLLNVSHKAFLMCVLVYIIPIFQLWQ